MHDEVLFEDRAAAGRALAERVAALDLDNPVILALPRGGVPVAAEIAIALRAPLDLVFVRKIGMPRNPEYAVAAVVDGGQAEIVLNEEVTAKGRVSDAYIDAETQRELAEIERRRTVYLAGRARVETQGRDLVVVDDGIATGASVRAALAALRRKNPKRLVLAVPLAPREALDVMRPLVDDIVCIATPEDFAAIGFFYDDFHQLTDAEVTRALDRVENAAKSARLPHS